ncbi:S-layer homology domain-containing protein [Halomicronema hongdechloris]|uniref:S-layer homology domain-containing protein n=1 Tax=Halomicronema hongdechloris TaxID=1209493 RepID=UPI001CECD703|nr:S-layer homology domain-containing protein [Halomicronema hongdechloris]
MAIYSLALGVCWLTLSSCAGSPIGESLQRSLESDPQLQENPPFGMASETDSSSPTVTSSTPDTPSSTPEATSRTPAPFGPAASSQVSIPEPGHPGFIGPVWPSSQDTDRVSRSRRQTPTTAPTLDQVPADLRPYVEDMLALDILPLPGDEAASGESAAPVAVLNQPIQRREYARWLLTANNAFYQDHPSRKIRPAVSSAAPAFQDVSQDDPAFASVQGLAEAGIIPSPLSGNATTVSFRPEAPLTRKDLLLWKVPLDTHQALPTASVEAVEETWGFQDAAKIPPLALRAVLADYHSGEVSNIRRAFGFTTLFQPDKPVTRAEALAVLWRFGPVNEGITAQQLLAAEPAAQAEQH